MSGVAYSSVPLIDEGLADELFSLQGDPEVAAMQQSIWQGVCMEIGPDLERTLRADFNNVRSELHRIRGYCSSCGLSRLAKLLYRWESEPGDTEAARRFGSLALDIAQQSIAAMNARYPHLRPASSGSFQ
jgi:hypothetical protein